MRPTIYQHTKRLFGHKEAFLGITIPMLWVGLAGAFWPAFVVFALIAAAYVVTA